MANQLRNSEEVEGIHDEMYRGLTRKLQALESQLQDHKKQIDVLQRQITETNENSQKQQTQQNATLQQLATMKADLHRLQTQPKTTPTSSWIFFLALLGIFIAVSCYVLQPSIHSTLQSLSSAQTSIEPTTQTISSANDTAESLRNLTQRVDELEQKPVDSVEHSWFDVIKGLFIEEKFEEACATLDAHCVSFLNSRIDVLQHRIAAKETKTKQLTQEDVLGARWKFYNPFGLLAVVELEENGLITGFQDGNVQSWRLSADGVLEFYNPANQRSIQFIFSVRDLNGKWKLHGPIYASAKAYTSTHYLLQV